MKKLLYILAFLLPFSVNAQDKYFSGSTITRDMGVDSVSGFRAINLDGTGEAGIICISGTDTVGFGVGSGVAAIGSTTNQLTLPDRIGIGTAPVTSSALSVTSTSLGFLCPRMTAAQKNAIVSPATGLLIYQTDGTPGFYYYTGAVWSAVGGASGITVGTTTITSGTTTRVGFNDGGVYGEDADFTWDKTNNILNIGAAITTTTTQLNIGGESGLKIYKDAFGEHNIWIGNTNNTTAGFVWGRISIGWKSSTGNFAVAIGEPGGGSFGTVAGNSSVAIGCGTSVGGQMKMSGDYAVGVGCAVSSTFNSTGAFGYGASPTAANQLVFGNAAAAGGTGVYDNVYFNGVTHTSAAPVIINSCSGSGSNNAGGSMTFATRSTGNATPPNIIFQTGTTLGSGTTLQTPATRLTIGELRVTAAVPVKLPGYTVAGLPTGSIGDIAYVTDATAPTYGAVIAGGGAVVTLVFYDGTNWTAH